MPQVDEAKWKPREYKVDVIVPASSTLEVSFGVEIDAEETRFDDFEETGVVLIGVEHDFEPDVFHVDAEDVDGLRIESIRLAGRSIWRLAKEEGVLAKRFAEPDGHPLKSIKNRLVLRGESIDVRVHNETEKPRQFRARFVGREKIS